MGPRPVFHSGFHRILNLFFFQAEEGIRDPVVTGVQTCALPISSNGLLRNAYRGKARATADRWDAGFFGFGPDQSNEFDLQTFEERTTLGLTANVNPLPWLENRLVLGMDKYDRRDQNFFRIDSTAKWGPTNGTGSMTQRVPATHTW